MTTPSAVSLLVASSLSIVLHAAALISWPQPPGAGPTTTTKGTLDVRLADPKQTAAPPSGPVAPEPTPVARATPARAIPEAHPPVDRPPRPARQASASSPRPEAPDLPVPVFPIEALSRLPTLVTEISPEDWPATPGAPSGSFRIEVDVGPDGRVTRVNPVCEPQMCEAAATYSGAIVGWRFVPAEILGHRVSSRIHVEFEIGSPESEGFSAAPVTPSRPAAPIVRPSEAAP